MRQTRIVVFALMLMAVAFTANAQIKVVGDGYSESLSATKNYYEKDLVFDYLFPQINIKERFKEVQVWTDDWSRKYNLYDFSLLGDTFYLPTDTYLPDDYNCYSFAIKHEGDSTSRLLNVPAGYYFISGYVFCNGGALRKKYTGKSEELPSCRTCRRKINDETRIKETKECFLVNEQEIKEKGISECLEYDYVLLKSIYDSNIFLYCRGLDSPISHNSSNNGYFRFLNVEFFNEFKKHFLEKKVSIIENQSYRRADRFIPRGLIPYEIRNDKIEQKHKFIKNGYIITDAMNNDKLKILDSVFWVKDVVLKGTDVYCILEGEKTGVFALKPININYSTPIKIGYDFLFEIECFSRPYFQASFPLEKDYFDTHAPDQMSLILVNFDDYYSINKEVENRYNTIKKQDETAKRQKQIEEENARLQKENEYQQAKKREQSEFRQYMIAKYGAEKGDLVGNRQVAVDMTMDMVRDAWGRPMNTYRTTTKYGQGEVWCYNYKTRVYFYNGKVVQIDD